MVPGMVTRFLAAGRASFRSVMPTTAAIDGVLLQSSYSGDHRRRQNRTTNSVVNRRNFHASPAAHNSVVLGGLVVAGGSLAAKYAIDGYRQYKDAQANQSVGEGDGENSGGNSFFSFFSGGSYYAKNFYDGPFEAKMTKREAALILGVRESAGPKRIKDKHRQMMVLNHPDTGGSTFLATKINDAKELLLAGRKAGRQ